MKADKVLLAHGSGSKASHDFVAEMFLPPFSNPALDQLNDSVVLDIPSFPKGDRGEKDDGPADIFLRLAYTTDSYVVDPMFFPGGDIGKLAVCGTVNDLAMSGATPLYLSASFIIEQGFPIGLLRQVVSSMRHAADEAKVRIVTGDTKVVNRGQVDKLFINTSGIGFVGREINISGSNAKVGDKVILSGSIGEHGIAVLSRREGLEFDTPITSDCAPLNSLVAEMLSVTPDIRCLRDPTRGGLATTLNELATQSNVGFLIEEANIPIKDAVKGACALLGYDALYVANEGKLVAVVPPESASQIVMKMRGHKYGCDSRIIGEVITEPKGVILQTAIGGSRILDMLSGELLPRIC